MRVFNALVGVFLSLAAVASAAAQNQDGADLTAAVSASYQIPAVEGRLLIPQGVYGTVTRTTERTTFGTNGARITQEIPQNTVVAPYGTPIALDLPGIHAAWQRFWALRNYRKAEEASFAQSVALGNLLLNASSRVAIAGSMGKTLPDGGTSTDVFSDFLYNTVDEFDRYDFHQLMLREYGATSPVTGFVNVLTMRSIDFGRFDSDENQLRILSETPFLVDLMAEQLAPERDFRTGVETAKADNFNIVNRAAYALKETLPLEPSSARPFVRALTQVTEDDRLRRRVWVAEAGRVVFPADPSAPLTYVPEQLTLYLDEGLTQPIQTIALGDLYENVELAREAKAKAREAARLEKLANAKAATTSFDVLGIRLGMHEGEVRTALSTRKAPFAVTDRLPQRTSTGASNCDAEGNAAIYQRIDAERLRLGGFAGDMSAENKAALAAFEAKELEPLVEGCRVDMGGFYSAFETSAVFGAGVEERAEIYFGTSGDDRGRVGAVIRRFQGAQNIPIDPLAALVARYGQPLHVVEKRENRTSDPAAPLFYWYAEPERALATEGVTPNCVFDDASFSRNNVFTLRRYITQCGHILALHYDKDRPDSGFSMVLVNSDLWGEAATRQSALRERVRLRAISLIEY